MRSLKAIMLATVLLLGALEQPSIANGVPDFDTVCGADALRAFPPGSSRAEHCAGARLARDTKSANEKITKVWAGVAAVCAASCFAPPGSSVWLQVPCWTADAGAIVKELRDAKKLDDQARELMAERTNKYGDALRTIGQNVAQTLGAQFLMNKNKEQEEKRRLSCGIAASAAMTTLFKFTSLADDQNVYESELSSAARFLSEGPGIQGLDTPSGTDPARPAAAPLAVMSSQEQTGDSRVPSSCTGENTGGAVVSCAVDMDPHLPSFVRSPKFQEEVQRLTGAGLEDLVPASTSSPAQSLADAMAARLDAENAGKVAALAGMMEQDVKVAMNTSAPSQSASYASAGGGGGKSGGSEEPDFGKVMQNLMGQMLGDPNGKAKPPTGVAAVAFEAQRSPASALAENRKLSIFDRVTYRYFFVGKKLITSGGRARQ